MLSLNELQEKMEALPEWSIAGNAIEKIFSFKTFKDSLAFANKVGTLAESLNHHPEITISYTNVKLVLTTHSERGVTLKDIELAKEIDKIEND